MHRASLLLCLFASLFAHSYARADDDEPAEEQPSTGPRPTSSADESSSPGPSSESERPPGGEERTDERDPEGSGQAGSEPASESKSGKKEERRKMQWAGVPIAGGNTDFGWGGGALVSVTRPSATNKRSKEWSAEMAAVAMFQTESFEPRFQDYYIKAIFDDVLGSGLRLTVRPSFTQVVGVNYYGLGNGAARGGPGLPDPDGPDRSYYDYTHADGTLRAFLSHDFSHQVRLSSGFIWSYVWMDVPANSRLASDAENGSEEVRSMLTGLDDHAFAAFVWTLEFDTRDHEVNPQQGIRQTNTLTFAPGSTGILNETWGRGFFEVAGFYPLFKDRVVLAGRALFDVLVGTPPVYELSRFDNYSNAFGGEKGVRGIEAQRYYGKVKLIANLESRISLFKFKLIGQNTLIFTQFFDFGRLWADFGASEELDGHGLGLKYSMGGGLHLLFDDSFVVALDAGWSPDAQPVGIYLTSGHAF